MICEVGKGKILYRRETPYYKGTLPFKKNQEVYVVDSTDLTDIISSEINALLLSKIQMPNEMFENGMFADELVTTVDNQKYKLFLERFLYSKNMKDDIWIRYISVDMGLYEEEIEND